jgi:peptide deformylase
MAAREIVTLPAPILRAKARRVKSVTPEIRQLLDDMVETVRLAPGVGLAAPQVGIGLRVIVVEYAESSEDPDAAPKQPKLYTCVNPEIVRRSSETISGAEGCLSIPGYLGEVDRHAAITVKGLNRQGEPFRVKATGWLARIFQHEIDHLDGVLFIDRATDVWKATQDEVEQAEGAPAAA